MYDDGNGLSQDYQKARQWYEKSTVQNDTQAQFDPGVMNERREGGSINPEQARSWYELAGKNGHKEGCERYKSLLRQ